MANSKFIEHVPCPKCDSEDNGSLYEDGSIFCHVCQWRGGEVGEKPEKAPEKKRPSSLLDVEYRDLGQRRLHEDSCRKYDYGTSSHNGASVQVATYYTPTGTPVAQKVRTADKKFTVRGDLSQAGLYGEHLWKGGGKILVITEGEIDAVSVAQVQGLKWPVVSIPSGAQSAASAISRSLEFVESFEKVVLMFDMDEPGKEAALAVADILAPGKVSIAALPLKDPNEMLKAGRGPEIVKAMWDAKPFRPDGIIEGEELWDMLKDRTVKPSVEWPWPELQQRTLGIRESEVVVITGGTSIGKTTAIREIEYHIASQGKKVGIVHLEEPVKESFEGLMGIHTDKPLHLDPKALGAEEYRQAYDELKDKFAFYDHWGSLDPEQVIAKMRYMIRGCGCEYIILDHLSIVVSGGDLGSDERRIIDKLMTDMTSLANETGAGIIVVSHLRKPHDKGKSFEEGKVPTLADLRGSGSIMQLGFTIVGLSRDLMDENDSTTKCWVLKCRHTGKTGKADRLAYDGTRGRLEDVQWAPENDNDDF